MPAVAEQVRVPDLRFPQYSGEWSDRRLGDLAHTVSGIALPSEDILEEGGTLIARGINIKSGFVARSLEIDRYTNLKVQDKFIVHEGDVLVPMDGSKLGKNVAIANVGLNGAVLIQRVARIRAHRDCCSGNYLFQLLFNWRFERYVYQVNSTSAIPHISLGQLNDYLIPIGDFEEQEKIAGFLTAVDERIGKLKRKKELLEEYKRGMMQKLFSQEVRFKDEHGRQYPDWSRSQLVNLGSTFSGLSGKSKEDFGQGTPFVQYLQVFSGATINLSDCGQVSIEEGERQTKLSQGDVLFTTSSETPNEIGMSSVVVSNIDSDVYLNSFCFGFRLSGGFVPSFSAYLFRSEVFRKSIVPLAQGSTRFNLSKSNFLKLYVSYPSFAEQERIAEFLTGLDEKLAHLGQRIEKAEEFKRGLLQKMFV